MENSPAQGGGAPVATQGLGSVLFGSSSGTEPTIRGILRVVVTVVASVFAIYLVYLLRTPLSWLFFATFVAISVSAPVNRLTRHMPRGAAIGIVYSGVILIPIAIGAILVPPLVRGVSSLVSDLPSYVSDLNQTIQGNSTLQDLNENYDLTQKLDDLASNAANSLDDAAATLADIGAGLVGSLFAAFTILVMSMFMVARGQSWTERALASRPRHEAEAIRRALDRMVTAVSSYVGGALAQATIAGTAAFIVLQLLGVTSPLALAVIIAILDLIPLIGATIGAIIVAVVTLFTGFPTVTIIWVVFAIAYQQFENYVVQPRIQSRAVELDPFLIVIAAIFGGTLIGVTGALLAIPSAAALQIGVREFILFRRTSAGGFPGDDPPPPPGSGGGPVSPGASPETTG